MVNFWVDPNEMGCHTIKYFGYKGCLVNLVNLRDLEALLQVVNLQNLAEITARIGAAASPPTRTKLHLRTLFVWWSLKTMTTWPQSQSPLVTSWERGNFSLLLRPKKQSEFFFPFGWIEMEKAFLQFKGWPWLGVPMAPAKPLSQPEILYFAKPAHFFQSHS